jgi:hypothetical protein
LADAAPRRHNKSGGPAAHFTAALAVVGAGADRAGRAPAPFVARAAHAANRAVGARAYTRGPAALGEGSRNFVISSDWRACVA